METQIDYETEPILAVFRTAEEADDAIQRLHAAGISDGSVARVKLPAGHYQAEDQRMHEEGDGVRRGATVGAPVGAVVGLGLAAVLPTGAAPLVVAGLAGMGALNGAILGGFVGAIARAHFDDDVAGAIDCVEGGAEVLVVVRAGGASNEAARARDALQRAGACGFLDATLSDTDPALRAVGIGTLHQPTAEGEATPETAPGQPVPPVALA